jgi:hypothetical protein
VIQPRVRRLVYDLDRLLVRDGVRYVEKLEGVLVMIGRICEGVLQLNGKRIDRCSAQVCLYFNQPSGSCPPSQHQIPL